MYLKRLDLQGFKSFPDKVKLEFNKGITAVVGPNGSGKSNISDSVRWVLGEQRVKSLRGDKMEDVIFAGTDDRKPLGFAEVSITLDNEDRKMNLDYSEITVTRTVFRSGESKYAINKTPCRLKDIHELFMDTGVGREGYSIIGQGRIDEILSSKSEDRRRLFEEAAGIVKYRTRRSEAIAKLEKEQQNLLRVEDIIGELESKIEPLERQNEKAKKYLDLKERLKVYEVNDFCVSVRKIDEERRKNAEAAEISKGNIADEEALYESLKQKSEALKAEDSAVSEKIQQLNNEKSRLLSEIERADGEIKLAKEQSANFEATIKRLEAEAGDRNEKMISAQKECEGYKNNISALNEKTASIEGEIASKESEYEKISGILENKQELIDNYKADIIEKIRITTEINTSIKQAELLAEQKREKQSFMKAEQEALNGKLTILEKTFEDYSKKKNALEREKESLQNDIDFLEKRKAAFIAEADKINYEIKNESMRLNECRSRIKVLVSMKNEFEGYYGSVKSVLKMRDSGALKGICGAVAELIETEKKYETAIEVAVGSVMQNIVVETEGDGKAAIEYLKKNNLGRASFMPVSVIKGRDLGSEKAEILKQKGVCGIADELVRYNSRYYEIVKNILGRVIIVDTMDNAILLAGKTSHKYKIVTLAGDVLNAGGTMTGGSISKKTGGIFGRNREISDLQGKEKELSALCYELTQKQEELDEEILDCSDELREVLLSQQKTELEKTSLEKEMSSLEENISETKKRVAYNNDELVFAEEEIALQEKNAEKYALRLEETEKEIEKINSEMSDFQNTVQSGREEREKLLSYITEKKISLAALKENRANADEGLKRLKEQLKALWEEEKAKAEEKKNAEDLRAEKEENCRLMLEEKEKSAGLLSSAASELDEISLKKAEFTAEFEKCINEQQSAFETVSKLKNDLYRLETKEEKLAEDRNAIFERIWEEYEITLEEAKKMYSEEINISEISREIKRLKNDIKDLGNVNVNAIEEYKEVKERYEFLTAQRNDIKEAEDSLLKVIDELAEMMRKQFKEQFAVISENFNEVFRKMFGGGQAYLKLADERDVLESGIEIIAQPPGKKLQNMMLLSGGERALTAIAILFGILKMKPSPFCILDEIEAALDDANVKRFSDYLKSFSGDTQFIVITHRKGTMEAADVMYGVTMQERGISKVLSVKFEEAQKDAI